ncbi:MAG TPA: alpha/beta family hydrolase [Gemmatimonadaceae bacterium]|nr:alpha/beta family hydrolase [Gemmatimonadaceae bacterium]
MARRRLWPIIKKVWITVGLSATVIFVAWSLIAFRASPVAREAIQSDASVSVQHGDGLWQFIPGASVPRQATSLVFFPGGLVDPVAYAPLARAAAVAGFPAYIIELPRRGAFGGANAPELSARVRRLLQQPGISGRWVVAGHSRGGVVASSVAAARVPGMAGVVLIGTSHPRDVDLSALDVPVTKISGTRDGLASRAKVEENRHRVPATTRWVWIEGGNHSQFGWYGFQPGDRRATITAEAQRDQMIKAVMEALAGT